MAYVLAQMRERVSVQFPPYWVEYFTDELKSCIGVSLLLLLALYGYTFSRRMLYEHQAEFLETEGFLPSPSAPAIWSSESQHKMKLRLSSVC